MSVERKCGCLYCEFSRALNAESLDRKRLLKLWNAIFELNAAEEQISAYVWQEAERAAARRDAPAYLREAVRIAIDESRRLTATFMGRAEPS